MQLEAKQFIGNAQLLANTLATALDSSGQILIDASRVESVDTAAIQTLALFAQPDDSGWRKVLWSEVSDSLRQAVHLLGLNAVFDFDQTIKKTQAQGESPK